MNCVDCEHFAWWDGDYCCMKTLKILAHSADGSLNDEIVDILEKGCKNFKPINKLSLKIYKDIYENYKNKNYVAS